MTLAVLDASALLALLLGEPGGETVRAVLSDAAMSTVNLAEVVGHYARNDVARKQIAEVHSPLPVRYIAPDAATPY